MTNQSDTYDFNQPVIHTNAAHMWLVTRPDGQTFPMRGSEWFMGEYYGKAGWTYVRITEGRAESDPQRP